MWTFQPSQYGHKICGYSIYSYNISTQNQHINKWQFFVMSRIKIHTNIIALHTCMLMENGFVSGRELVVLRNPWSTRNWPMPSGQVWIRSRTVASPCGGPRPSTEPTYVQGKHVSTVIYGKVNGPKIPFKNAVEACLYDTVSEWITFIAGLCGFPSTTGFDRNLHAWKNPHPEDFPHSDL